MHVEAGSADKAGVTLCRTHIPSIFAEVKADDIYNLDESGLFYRRPPMRSLMQNLRKAVKLCKQRCTLNMIVNATGNDIHLQLIGVAKHPRW